MTYLDAERWEKKKKKKTPRSFSSKTKSQGV